jgi:GNAT superfamily N-acetyltransferase/catechol 2,3-dioxygenase-like lactoylglutathione lyase family enzyme
MPRSTGLFEAHLLVADLERSVEFYRDRVGLALALEVPDRGAAFFWIGAPGQSMLGLWSLGSAPVRLSSHIALRSPLEDVLGACDALRANGVTPLSFFGVETNEPSVIGWMPAAAVYFRDPDGHLMEYLAMLEGPPQADRGIVTWSEWQHGTSTSQAHVQPYTGSRGALRPMFEEAEDSAQQLDAYIDSGEVLVAVTDGAVVGHLQLIDHPTQSAGEIKNMAVDREHRGRGIGRMLVNSAADVARHRGHSTLTVATAAADTGNLRFYQRAGFRMRTIERDAFTSSAGYDAQANVDGIPLCDRVWLDLDLGPSLRVD